MSNRIITDLLLIVANNKRHIPLYMKIDGAIMNG